MKNKKIKIKDPDKWTEFIVGEIHNSKSQQWHRLIKFITKTHRIVYTDYEHVFTFRKKNE